MRRDSRVTSRRVRATLVPALFVATHEYTPSDELLTSLTDHVTFCDQLNHRPNTLVVN